jgi:hypothetical protein
MPIIKQTQSTLLLGYQVNETGMLNQTTVSAPSIPVLKRRIAQSCRLYGAEYNKGNSYLRLGVRLNYFGKFDKLLIEPH